MVFDERTQVLLDAPNLAVVSALTAEGAPHTSTVWYLRDGDAILISVTADKLKARNLARDPRISLTVSDRDNPDHPVDIRGTAERYLGEEEEPPDAADVKRLVVRVVPARVTVFSE